MNYYRHLMTTSANPALMSADDGAQDAGAAGGAGAAAAGAGDAAAQGGDSGSSVAAAAGGDPPAGDNAGDKVGDAARNLLGDAKAPDDKAKDGDAAADAGGKDDKSAQGEGDAKDGEKPAVPEAYELKVEVDGKPVELDAGLLEKATPIFKELGLSNDQASRIAQLYATEVMPGLLAAQESAASEAIVAQAKAWEQEVLNDKDLGGGKVETLNENLTYAARFRDAFGGPELTEFLKSSALGNHPLLVKTFVRAGKAIAEGGFHISDRGAQPKPKDDGELFYGSTFRQGGAAAA